MGGVKLLKISELCSFEYGIPLPEKNRIAGNYPVVGSNGIVGYHNVFFLNQKGTVVIGRKGSAGKVTWVDEPCTPIDTTFYLKEDKEKSILKFLYFILRFKEDTLIELGKGTGVPGLNRNEAYQIKIPVPPLTKQQEIVSEIEGYEAEILKLEKIMQQSSGKKKAVLERFL